MKAKEVERLIKKDGWYEVRQRGSHRVFQHPTKKGNVILPMHTKDLGTGILIQLEKDSGVKIR